MTFERPHDPADNPADNPAPGPGPLDYGTLPPPPPPPPSAAYAAPPYPPQQWPSLAPPQGRNGFSIAGLVLGILPVLGGILGIVFGLIGRSQATRRGQRGRTMGTWGAALGATWLALIVVGVAVDIGNDAERDGSGRVVEAGDESAFDLQVGDCLRTLPDDLSEVSDVDLVACTRSHAAEVFLEVTLDGTSYPGTKAVEDRADTRCEAGFERFVGKAYDDSALDMFYLYPTKRSWGQGDRTVTCVVSGKRLVGTVKGSGR